MSIKEQKTKLMILESRILKWKLAGPEATNADPEWKAMNKDLALVRNFIRALKRYPDKNRLQVAHMKMLNTIWHRYGTKQVNLSTRSWEVLIGLNSWRIYNE